jgi:hypothetical protein
MIIKHLKTQLLPQRFENQQIEYIMILGIFDFLVIALIIITNFYLQQTRTEISFNFPWVMLFFMLFSFILPIISSMIEIAIVTKKFDMVDGFNLLYVYFRWPIYWIIGIIEIIMLNIFRKSHESETEHISWK